jgi:hypothetical protein
MRIRNPGMSVFTTRRQRRPQLNTKSDLGGGGAGNEAGGRVLDLHLVQQNISILQQHSL